MSARIRVTGSRLAAVFALTVFCVIPAVASADESATTEDHPAVPPTPPADGIKEDKPVAPPSREKVNVNAVVALGAATGKFFGLTYRSVVLDGGVRVELGPVGLVAGGDAEVGRTEGGLPIYRLAMAGGLENAGRFRVGVGPRLSYTMVERATRDSSFMRALFGDIGGFGLGAQGWVAADFVRSKRLSIGASIRVAEDLYDGSSARRLDATLEVAF